jgi:DnaA family protein
VSRLDKQLALNIGLREGVCFASFHAVGNEEPLHALQQLIAGEGETVLYLWGRAGVGKSHLLQAACQAMAETDAPTAYIPLSMHDELDVAMLQDLENTALICVDDVQAIAGDREWETALFNLFNAAHAAKVPLVFSADAAAAELGLGLPDLATRLAWGLTLHMAELNDDEKIAALRLRAQQRGFELPLEVGRYLLQRSPRNTDVLFDLLDRLDQASLVAQRKLTIPFVRELIR